MKTKQFSRWFSLTLLIAVIFVTVIPVAAQEGDDIWAEVIDTDGNILYDNLIDQGVQTESADWMPSVTVLGQTIGGEAEYHIYETSDGTIVQLPTATTLFFMALNPAESGIGDASASHFTGAGGMLAVPGLVSAMLQGADIDLSNSEYVSADQYADALIAGEADIWSLGVGDVWGLMTSLARLSGDDFLNSGEINIYTALLLYTPDNIPEEIAELLPDDFDWTDVPNEPADHPTCPAGFATPGKITTSGTMVAPNYPLVVGQDPDKRGVDLSFSASVAPTIWTYWEEVPIWGMGTCGSEKNNNLRSCETIIDWTCEQRTRSYPETIPVAYASATLSSNSKDWILNTLSIRYPGAYIHNGSFKYPSSPGGSTWSFDRKGVQVQDPGTWGLTVRGRTSGTPVSDSRNFGGEAGSFQVYLKETAIIE